MDLNQALVLPISGNGNHRHMQSLVGMRSAALIPPAINVVRVQSEDRDLQNTLEPKIHIAQNNLDFI